MAVVILEPRKIKFGTVSTFPPSICHEVMGQNAIIFVFLMLSFIPVFSLSSFTLIKRLFTSSSFSAIREVSAYLRLLIFLLAILIPTYASSSPAFHMMYSALQLNKQGDNIQPRHTPFPILNQSVVPCLKYNQSKEPLLLSQELGKLLWILLSIGIQLQRSLKIGFMNPNDPLISKKPPSGLGKHCLQPSLTLQGSTSPSSVLESSSPASCSFQNTQAAKPGTADLKRKCLITWGIPGYSHPESGSYRVLTPNLMSSPFSTLPAWGKPGSALPLRMGRNSPIFQGVLKPLPANQELSR